MLLFQDLCSTNRIFCYVLFRSVVSHFRNLKCYSFLVPAMFGVELSAVEWCLFMLPFWVGSPGNSDPVSLTSHLFTSSVHATDYLVRPIIDFKTFEWDSHFDHVSFNKQFDHQQLGATIDEEFNQLLTLCDPMQQWTIWWAKTLIYPLAVCLTFG